MIDEGMKLTVFDAMEAVMELSDIYHKYDPDCYCTFRFTGIMEAVGFYFGKSGRFSRETRCEITVFLDGKTEAKKDDENDCEQSLDYLFKFINFEKDRLEPIKKEKEYVNSDIMGREECK